MRKDEGTWCIYSYSWNRCSRSSALCCNHQANSQVGKGLMDYEVGKKNLGEFCVFIKLRVAWALGKILPCIFPQCLELVT